MKIAQILLYNQLRKDFVYTKYTHFIYIHHVGKIKFNGKNLRFNMHSKIIDYAGGRQMIDSLDVIGKKADFIISKDFESALRRYANENKITKFVIIRPVEDYVYKNFLKIESNLLKDNIEMEFLEDTESFFLSHSDFLEKYKKPPIMEYFYRYMRKKEGILIDEHTNPEGGKWNYDTENRKFDKKHKRTWNFQIKKNKYMQEAEDFYNFTCRFIFPSNRQEALQLLEYFLLHHLDYFGSLEDAMYESDPYVHHSLLSSCINYGFLSPREVVNAVVETNTAMNNKEGFVRQVLGWREYMYHFFHFYKDTIYTENFFHHTSPLPEYFWKKPEKCPIHSLRVTLEQVHRENISHHIQRLMIIGNFSLLARLNPHELNHWFFEYYIDAFEWVVTPNVLSMSQFADGGKLATKPYVSSANYIHKMSDYYKNSLHDPKEKYSSQACPFNYLYWCFVHDNKEVFEKGRQQFVVKNLQKQDIEAMQILKEKFLKQQYSL